MPQTTAAPSLRKAIEIYRAQHNEELDEHADKLLKRLADSPKAAKAFKRLQPKDDYDEAAIVRERQSAGARAFLNRMKKGNPQAARAIEQQLKLEDRGKPQWPYPQSPRLVAIVKRKLAAKVTAGTDRSAQFQSAVNAAVRAGMTADQFEELARQHCSGCVSKYLETGDRLRAEIDRSWSKTEEAKETGPAPDDSIDGAELLDKIHAFLGQFIVYPDRHARVAHTVWIAHCHLVRCFETTPRLAFLSPEPSSGKTRALEITELLVPSPVLAVNVSPAYLIRRIGAEEGVTVLFDEVDTVFGPRTKENNEDVRALLNAGYRRGAIVGRYNISAQQWIAPAI